MTHQLTFATAHDAILSGAFTHHLPAQRHSETSKAAAEMAMPSALRDRERVLNFIKARGIEGSTDEELQFALLMQGSTQRPRRVELVKLGLVIDSGSTRKTISNRSATVWVAI